MSNIIDIALTGVARAHQASGLRIVVCSTGAQAAERLTAELSEAGVRAEGYSTVALQAAVRRGTVTLAPGVTVIHDEAALASTREQAWLLEAVAGVGHDRGLGPIAEQARHVPKLTPEIDRGHGRGMGFGR